MAVAIGVVNNDGSVILNPPMDYPLSVDTGIVVIAEDDDSYEAVQIPFDVITSYFYMCSSPLICFSFLLR